jgi:lipoate-protein ligase A
MHSLPTRETPNLVAGYELDLGGHWQVERVLDVERVEVGLTRQQARADALIGQSSTPWLLIWRSQPALLVSRSETRLPRFTAARDQLQTEGWPVVLRNSGGGACPVGPATVQISMVEPALPAATLNAKYAALAAVIKSALAVFGIAARAELVAGAYCPGSYDLAVDGRKIAGMVQHWFRNRLGLRCIITVASVNVEEPPDMLARVVNQFYSSAGSAVRCQATALTNMRLCVGTNRSDGHDLTKELMGKLESMHVAKDPQHSMFSN